MNAETRRPTCEERIANSIDSFVESVDPLLKFANEDELALSEFRTLKREYGLEPHDQSWIAEDRLTEYPLAVETLRIVRVTLSTGGPGSWLEAHIDDDGEIGRIEYHFNDWFDHASRTLSGHDYTVAEQFIRHVAILEPA